MVFGLLAVLFYSQFCCKVEESSGDSAGVLEVSRPILLLILAVYFVASLYLTVWFRFRGVTVALLAIYRSSLLPLNWMDLAQLWSAFTVIGVCIATLIILRHKDNIQRIKKKENLPWGKNITHQQLKKTRVCALVFDWASSLCFFLFGTLYNSMIPSLSFHKIASPMEYFVFYFLIALGGSSKS